MKNSLDTARDEGIEIGVEKGKIEVAKNLISLGLDNETIGKATGLSIEEIERLRNE